MRPDVAHDFNWGRQFLPEVRSILGRYLIAEAPFDEDAQRATDLIVLRLEAVRIAVRIRRAEHEASYGGEFTLRASRPSGAETELAKVIAGWGDYMFYGFGGDDGRLGAWVLGDLRVFRLWHASQMMRLPERQFPGKALPNRDGSSTFHAFRIDDLPSSFAVARKHARQRAAA